MNPPLCLYMYCGCGEIPRNVPMIYRRARARLRSKTWEEGLSGDARALPADRRFKNPSVGCLNSRPQHLPAGKPCYERKQTTAACWTRPASTPRPGPRPRGPTHRAWQDGVNRKYPPQTATPVSTIRHILPARVWSCLAAPI